MPFRAAFAPRADRIAHSSALLGWIFSISVILLLSCFPLDRSFVQPNNDVHLGSLTLPDRTLRPSSRFGPTLAIEAEGRSEVLVSASVTPAKEHARLDPVHM